MQIDRRITNGLAWAGVLLVVGVPTADLLSAQFLGDRPAQEVVSAAVVSPAPATVRPIPAPASQRPTTQPAVEVAAVEPAKPVVAPVAKPTSVPVASTPRQDLLPSGKPMPSYITDGNSAEMASAQPAPQATTPAPATAQPVAVAPAQQIAVTPRPSTPAPVAIDPVEVAAIPAATTAPAVVAPTKVAPTPMPLAMRPRPVAPVMTSTAEPVLIVPDRVVAPLPPANITAQDLEDWESGPLSEFLANRQQQQGNGGDDGVYDEDGFFLDEGPNGQRQPRDRVIGPAEDVYFFPFTP